MKNKIIVEKILKYIQKVLSYVEGIDYDSFTKNTMLVEACVFNLSQIEINSKFMIQLKCLDRTVQALLVWEKSP